MAGYTRIKKLGSEATSKWKVQGKGNLALRKLCRKGKDTKWKFKENGKMEFVGANKK